MNPRWLFSSVAALALLAGLALWLVHRDSRPGVTPVDISPAALYASSFHDVSGAPHALGRYEGHWVVLNFWATWCPPCREEMPGFSRLQAQWGDRVQFVGVANDDPSKVARFASDLHINYPLLVGGDEVSELSRRLGDEAAVLPFTVIVDPKGEVREQKVGVYSERQLNTRLLELLR